MRGGRQSGRRDGRGRSAPSATELHRAWLDLVDTDGPFLAVPELKRVYGTGMPRLAEANPAALAVLKDAKARFEKVWEAWDRDRRRAGDDADDADDDGRLVELRAARDAWVETVLREVAGWGPALHTDLDQVVTAAGPLAGVRATSPDGVVSVGISGALARGDQVAALLLVVDPVESLRTRPADDWSATPIDRMELLLRAAQVPVGVVTDGRWWALVCAQQDAEGQHLLPASGVFDAQSWVEEPAARDAFLALLSPVRLLGGRPADRLPVMFANSIAAAEEITEALGVQVRRAVELLATAFSEESLRARSRGEPDPLPARRDEVYQAAVTVMMRVVFLLFAEQRSLLPENRLFEAGYALSSQLDALDTRATDEGSEVLDGTHLTWHRLLATSQALYAGATFDDLRMPAYGGSLFDPDRFAVLLAHRPGGTLAVQISDRVMLEVLRAVQEATLKGERRRISFRDIDVEQIGYIYEGLLGYSCTEVDEVTVGLIGTEGAEPEITLVELEDLAGRHHTPALLAAAVLAVVKRTQPDAKPPSTAALAKAFAAEVDDAERALLAVTDHQPLRERLRPFLGAIRRDLRHRPTVVEPGGLVVVETPSRASAGAHYTPRALAEEVVEHALAPLIYRPGPHQGPRPWRLVSSEQILELRVADIACGSGAFLVAAARYLADRLVEAWRHEHAGHGTAEQMHRRAVREVVARCLYGADINAMAVEMCKLSLWLVSLDPKLPFSFVDDKVLHGNSLLGLTDRRQLENLHLTPGAQRQDTLFDTTATQTLVRRLDVDDVLREAISLRRALASDVSDSDPARMATTKRRQWARYADLVAQLSHVADGVIAAGLHLGGQPGRALEEAYENLRVAVGLACPGDPTAADPTRLEEILAAGLTPTVPTDHDRWKPLHWFLGVPDVLENGGFDAVIGNPPFLGGKKISGAQGSNAREWLVNVLAERARGNADLVAYFFLRAMSLLNDRGTLGLIATNTVAQGDTREVGLDRMVSSGFTITRAIQSRSWPSASANLEYAAIWGTVGAVAQQVPRVADDVPVTRISTLLEPAGRIHGSPRRLAENVGMSYIGCYVLGMGFVIDPERAQKWIEDDQRNAEVLFPYLGGEDVNSRPDLSAPRWVIDFFDRSEPAVAERYPGLFAQVKQTVRPERLKVNRKALRDRWWQYADKRPALRKAIAGLDEVLVITRVSRTVMPARVPTGQVLSDALVVFATDSYVDQAVLSASPHQLWAITYGSTLETRVRYTPSDVFETYPRPEPTAALEEFGRCLDSERREVMLRRELGLTKLYNLVNDPAVSDSLDGDVARLRAIHVDLDRAVMAAYGSSDVPLDHGFHTYRRMRRWTVSPAARVEILDRLLEENHRRAAAQGEAVQEDTMPQNDSDETDDDLNEEGEDG